MGPLGGCGLLSTSCPPSSRLYCSMMAPIISSPLVQLYKNSSSRKIDSRRLLSREKDFPKTFSLTENQFSRKTYLIQLVPGAVRRGVVVDVVDEIAADRAEQGAPVVEVLRFLFFVDPDPEPES